MLTLKKATLKGDQVQQVEILQVQGSDGFDLAAELDSGDSSGLEVGPAGEIVCTLPCGFGERPGRWRVEVAGPKGSTGVVTTEADYSDFEGGCPSDNSSGSEVSVNLAVAN